MMLLLSTKNECMYKQTNEKAKNIYPSTYFVCWGCKEGWASDMFITSTFSVIRSRSLWPNLYAPVILPYILKTISWIHVILGILVLCETTIDIIINVSHLDLYFMVQWFCHISWILCDVWTSLFGTMNQYDSTVEQKVIIGHCELYFMAQWFYVTSWR